MKKFSVLLFLILLLFLIYGKKNEPANLGKIQTIEITSNQDQTFYALYGKKEIDYLPLNKVNPKTIDMLINIEDKNFYSHSGIDVFRTIKATITNITSNELTGASTITQQFARNMYLDNEKTIRRKMVELYFSARLERACTKKEILEGYLNTVYFGHGIYGLKAAADFFFNRDPSTLTISESAMLIGILNSPGNYSPLIDLKKAYKKRNSILKKTYQNDIINKEEYTSSVKEGINIYGQKNIIYGSTELFFKDMVLNELKQLGFYDKANYDHIIVHTAFDESLNRQLSNTNIESPFASIGILSNGSINLFVGGNDYYQSSFNCALSNLPLGSTVKPFLYYQALASGLSPLHPFISEPTVFSGNYHPQNASLKYENAPISMLYALATSNNIYAVKMLEYLGQKSFVNILKKVKLQSHNHLSLALGTNEDTLFNLTKAYTILANMGTQIKPYFITKITNEKGKVIYEKRPYKEKILDYATTFVLNELLESTFDYRLNNINKVTASFLPTTKKYAAKTGTTLDNHYMIGFNPLITISVWSKENNAKYLWVSLMEHYMTDKDDVWYEKPLNVTYQYVNPSLLESPYKKWVPFKNPLPYY